MTPARLETIGKTLYGDRWRPKLARALGIDARTITFWHKGAYSIPEKRQTDIKALMMAKKAELGRLAKSF